MTLLWIGNLIFLLVVIPAVLLCLEAVMQPIRQIKAYADDIGEHGAQFGPHLEAVQELTTTRELVKEVAVDLERYCAALDRTR